MNTLFYSASSGLFAFQEELNTIGHNMANVGTNGYQPSRSKFQELLATRMDVKGGNHRAGHGVRADERQLLIQQGNLNQTNRELDFAIMGDGFFAADRSGQIEYTRNGSFSVSAEGNTGYLVDSEGGYLLDRGGNRISFRRNADTGTFDLSEVESKLGVWNFDQPEGIIPASGSGYLSTAASGTAFLAEESAYQLMPNALEQSATSLSDEMANMITAQRGYQMSARLVQVADETEETLNRLRNG